MKISAYKDFDCLQYKNFSNTEEFIELLNECTESFKNELEQKYTGIEFDHFEFSYDYDSSCGDCDNYRSILCIYFNRDETAIEKIKREEIEEETKKRKAEELFRQEEMKKKMEEAEYQNYLRLKEKFGSI